MLDIFDRKGTMIMMLKHCTRYTVSTEKGMLLLHKIYVVDAQTMSLQDYVSTT